MTTTATRTARAAVMLEPGVVELREYGLPDIGREEALLRVELAGICGTDTKILHGRFPGVEYPVIPGHEICGTIEEIGTEAAARWGVGVGDRVAVDSFLVCGRCEPCLNGDTRYCEVLGDYGISMGASRPPHLWGGFAEFVYLPPTAQVHPLAPPLTPELGVLVPAVVSNALRWLGDFGGAGVGSSVLVLGPGPIGLAAVVVARALGATQVLISGLRADAYRLQLAVSMGADAALDAEDDLPGQVRELTGGRGVDVALDVSGAPSALVQAAASVRKQGRVVLGGLTGGRPVELPVDRLVLDEISVAGVFSHDRSAVQRALRLVERQPEAFSGMVTHAFGLDDVVRAIDTVSSGDPGVLKVAIDPWA
jgi:alcohol dehydrogenase